MATKTKVEENIVEEKKVEKKVEKKIILIQQICNELVRKKFIQIEIGEAIFITGVNDYKDLYDNLIRSQTGKSNNIFNIIK